MAAVHHRTIFEQINKIISTENIRFRKCKEKYINPSESLNNIEYQENVSLVENSCPPQNMRNACVLMSTRFLRKKKKIQPVNLNCQNKLLVAKETKKHKTTEIEKLLNGIFKLIKILIKAVEEMSVFKSSYDPLNYKTSDPSILDFFLNLNEANFCILTEIVLSDPKGVAIWPCTSSADVVIIKTTGLSSNIVILSEYFPPFQYFKDEIE